MPASNSEVYAQDRAQVIHKWWAAEFCELARGIWQNLPWKTVGPINNTAAIDTEW